MQALLLLVSGSDKTWRLVDAAPVSTGLSGRYEHFKTPLGVVDHPVAHLDYRAEGTKNNFGIRARVAKASACTTSAG